MTSRDAQLVAELAEYLGWGLVAYVTGANSAESVREWAKGAAVPPAMLMRVKIAHVTMTHASGVSDRRTALTWFVGLNPRLMDRSIATMIREGIVAEEGEIERWADDDLG